MIALTTLVVITDAADTTGAEVQTVLVVVRPGRDRCRKLPHDKLDNRAVVPHFLGMNEEDGIHVLHGSNTCGTRL